MANSVFSLRSQTGSCRVLTRERSENGSELFAFGRALVAFAYYFYFYFSTVGRRVAARPREV